MKDLDRFLQDFVINCQLRHGHYIHRSWDSNLVQVIFQFSRKWDKIFCWIRKSKQTNMAIVKGLSMGIRIMHLKQSEQIIRAMQHCAIQGKPCVFEIFEQKQKKLSTPMRFERMRAKPSRFLVCLLNHSDKVSFNWTLLFCFVGWEMMTQTLSSQSNLLLWTNF